MNQFFSSLLTWALFILSCGLFYLAVTISFPTAFINIALGISAVFCLVQACGQVDKRHGFGNYSGSTNNSKDVKENESKS